MSGVTALDAFRAGFVQEPGYLNWASAGPLSATVGDEVRGFVELQTRSRFGAASLVAEEGPRMRRAAARVLRFPDDQVVFQPDTGTGLMHAMFGLTGGVLLSPAEYPAMTYAAARAAEALHVTSAVPLVTDQGRVTPARIREQLSNDVVAVAVSLVDARTGYLADIDGIRQVIGDRLLIVDAVQGLGVVNAPWEVADVVVAGGQKWLRAGKGTGLMALSARALDRLVPVWSGVSGMSAPLPFDEVRPPADAASAFAVSAPSPMAEAQLAASLEEIAEVGEAAIAEAVAERVERILELADEYGVPVGSSRDTAERAGIVVLDPAPERLTALTASLHNHGVVVTVRAGRVRLSAHVGAGDDTLGMLRDAFVSFASAPLA